MSKGEIPSSEIDETPTQAEGQDDAREISGLRTRLDALEAYLIAQDHRAIPVLRKFFARRSRWVSSDPRRQAALTAFLWWVVGGLTSPAGAAVGLAAFLTLAITGWNAWEFRQQNTLLAEQNSALKRQFTQQAASQYAARRAQLLATIYEEECQDVQSASTREDRSQLCWLSCDSNAAKESSQTLEVFLLRGENSTEQTLALPFLMGRLSPAHIFCSRTFEKLGLKMRC